MLPTLDIHPTDFNYARECGAEGRFVFCVQGDPRVTPQLFENMAYIRKRIVQKAKYGIETFITVGSIVNVPAVDLVTFSRDVGIQQWGHIKFNGPECSTILKELPGPIARCIWCIEPSEDTVKHLYPWYHWNGDYFMLKGYYEPNHHRGS